MTAIQEIFIDQDVRSLPLTKKILKKCPGVPRKIIRNQREVDSELASSDDPIARGKRILRLSRQKGAFVKPCPCTPDYLGCNYFIINAALNCPLDCSYCILQLYLTNPVTMVFVNLEDLWKELDVFLGRLKKPFIRIGTGEVADSLALDPVTETAGEFISYFRGKGKAVFELKTKTTNIDAVLAAAPAENVVVSWSVNSETIAREEETDAPPVAERIEAARVVSARGFPVGFHFDPLILYPGWEEGYARVIENLFRSVNPSRIRWLSLGSLRFPPALKPIIERRFPQTRIIYEEMVQGKDGKLRYFKPLRLELYRKIVGLIEYWGGSRIPLYFCMEDAEVWRKALKKNPGRKEEVELLFSPRIDGS